MAKQVDDREKAARVVGAGIAEHSPAMARALMDELRPFADDGVVPDVELLLKLIGRAVAAPASKLVAANEVHERELGDDAEPRSRRDNVDGDLRPRVSRLRTLVDGAYGAAGLAQLRLVEAPGPGPDALRSYVRTASAALVNPDVKLTPLDEGAADIKLGTFAATFAPLLDALETALNDVARERREGETSLVAKQDAMQEHDRKFARWVAVVEYIARAAGHDKLANRLRPSTREPGVLAEPIDDAELDAPPLAGGGAGDAPSAKPKVPIAPGLPGAEPFDDET